jgi:anaerobic ribonucleoside-triphosphate reductase activating protein
MNYHAIRYQDTLNGPGFRTVIFVSGCEHHCKGCHNPETWDPNSGNLWTIKEIDDVMKSLKNEYVDGLTLSGGDPLMDYNRSEVKGLCRLVKETYPEKTIWVYTGYRYEECLQFVSDYDVLENIDVLVDGPFIEDLKDPNCLFAGSTNQRKIDVRASMRENKVVLWKPKFRKGDINGNI